MAINRTWYNTLVDDDGSGLTGSIWDKEDVNQLLIAVDAELTRITATGAFAPTLTCAGGGAPVYSKADAHYARAGTIVFIGGHITIASKGSLAGGGLRISGLPFPGSWYAMQAALQSSNFTGIVNPLVSINGVMEPSQSTIRLQFIPPGGVFASSDLDVSMITDGFSLVFGGVYKMD